MFFDWMQWEEDAEADVVNTGLGIESVEETAPCRSYANAKIVTAFSAFS